MGEVTVEEKPFEKRFIFKSHDSLNVNKTFRTKTVKESGIRVKDISKI